MLIKNISKNVKTLKKIKFNLWDALLYYKNKNENFFQPKSFEFEAHTGAKC